MKNNKILAILGIIIITLSSIYPIISMRWGLTLTQEENNLWSQPEILTNNFNYSFIGRTMHGITFMDNSISIVFYSNGNNSMGNYSIYYSERNSNWENQNIILKAFNISKIEETHEMPVIDIDITKTIHVIWRGKDQSLEGDFEIFYSNYKNGVWNTPINISSNNKDDYYPDFKIDKQNRLHLSWFTDNGAGYDLIYLMRVSNFWVINQTLYQNITKESINRDISLCVSDSGNVAIAFTNKTGTINNDHKIIITEKIGNSWNKNEFIENLSNLYYPEIKYDIQNNLHLIFSKYNYSSSDMGIFYSFKTGGDWSEAVNLSATNKEVYHSSFDIDVNGRIHLIFSQRDDSSSSDYELFYINNTIGNFLKPINITKNNIDDYTPAFRLDDLGYGNIIYYFLNDSNYYVSYIKSVNPLSVYNYTPFIVLIIVSSSIICISIIAILIKVKPKKIK